MHEHGVDYDKKVLAHLYGPGGKVGEVKGLRLLYILLRMFRESIAASAGNLDAIHGGLVNLMHHAYCVFLAGCEAEGNEIDVMDFIYNEMYHAMLDRKTPPYAPYVMRLQGRRKGDEQGLRHPNNLIFFINVLTCMFILYNSKPLCPLQHDFAPSKPNGWLRPCEVDSFTGT
jgi:hypothetical protein